MDISTSRRQDKRFLSVFSSGLFQIFTLILFLAAVLNQLGELAFLAVLILLVFNGSRLWAYFSLARLNSNIKVDRQRFFPGENITLRATLTNQKILPVWVQLALPLNWNRDFQPPVTFHPEGSPGAATSSPVEGNILQEACSLGSYQQAVIRWDLHARRRGVYKLPELKLQSGDLLGFYHQEKTVDSGSELLVLPRVHPLSWSGIQTRIMGGSLSSSDPVTDPVHPIATRDYHQAHPARFIHWKASARRGRLQEKIFEPSAQVQILLGIEVSAFAKSHGEMFEYTLEAAASLAVKMSEKGVPVGMFTNGSLQGGTFFCAPRENSPYQAGKVLENLARLEMREEVPWKEVLLQPSLLPTSCQSLLFTGKIGEKTREAVSMMRHLRIPVTLITSFPSSLPGTKEGLGAEKIVSLEEILTPRVPEEQPLGERGWRKHA